jgi:thiol-disulfide isomerase/thioredoxin
VDKAKTLKEVTDLYKGKVIFMDIWATWCGPCRESFAHVKEPR